MLSCPNCGGELLFDPGTQKLKCGYCDSLFNPAEVKETSEAEEKKYTAGEAPEQDEEHTKDAKKTEGSSGSPEEFDVIEYTCPQCGGSLYSTNESVNAFCCYCGANHVLASRMAKMRAPRGVIPFHITKEQCKNSYVERVKKAIFAPRELMDPAHLEQFRGIYMPYWTYDVQYNAPLIFIGTRSFRAGDYIITEHYECSCDINSYYMGLSFDASSSFDDHFSERIEPYNVHAMMHFLPSYLSGFYADMQDVDYRVYMDSVVQFVTESVLEGVRQEGLFSGLNIEAKSPVRPNINPDKDVSISFYPVWFLSYRKRDRMAYAVVNGATGRISCDLPVDNKRFILFSLLLSLPIFALMMLFPAMKPETMLVLAGVLAVVSTVMLSLTVKEVNRREFHLDDLGYLSKYDRAGYAEEKTDRKEQHLKKVKKKRLDTQAVWQVFGIILVLYSLGGSFIVGMVESIGDEILNLVILAVMIFLFVLGVRHSNESKSGKVSLLAAYIVNLVSMVCANLIVWIAPVSDLYYYAAAILLLGGIVLGQIFSLRQYNLLVTRPLPQLDRKGGNADAPGNA